MITLGLQRQVDRRAPDTRSRADSASTATVHSLAVGRAACIAAKQPRARATLALLGDKEFLFSASGQAFLMYRRSGRCFVAMGDPVGPTIEWSELIERFSALALSENGWPVYYQVEPKAMALYEAQGLSYLKVGEEACISLPEFSLQGSKRSRLRQTIRRTEREGATFEMIPARSAGSILEDLKDVSDAWLGSKRIREKSFSLGAFDPSYLLRCPIAVVRQNDRIVAFANLWRGEAGSELGVDLMRYSDDAACSVMEYLFIKMLLWGRDEGYQQFSLGMAPLAGLDSQESVSLWDRAGAAVYKHGERFYNFRGVREYKAKFSPEWESRYLVSPGGMRLPLSIAAVSSLIAGRSRSTNAR